MFLRNLAILSLLAVCSIGQAEVLNDKVRYYPENFYTAVEDGERDSRLKRLMYSVLSSAHLARPGRHDQLVESCPTNPAGECYRHTSLGYTRARTILFGELHLEKADRGFAIRDAYCQHLTTANEFGRNPPGPGQIPDPSVLNAEHTWPQSRFNRRFNIDLQKSDLHILYPVLANANTSRSNHPFSEVVTEVTSPCPPSRRGYAVNGNQDIFFEPPDVHKGNVARAVMYFAIRYQLAIAPDEEASLKKWHRRDPPDEFERQRNEIIFAKQKVRNPFIDHPELVDLIADF